MGKKRYAALQVFTLVDRTAGPGRQCQSHPDALMRIVGG